MTWHPRFQRSVLCLVPGVVAFLVAASVSVWVPTFPNLHDDFGNLLVADTLWHGRFSNPTPPSHELLQTFHVVVEPKYAAKFPIGSGAFLALGRLLFGSWHTGIWIAAGLACAAMTWMLLAELPKRWAWAFGMFCALHPMWQTGWSQEYTHGWLAVAAMAMVLGGLLRMRRAGPNLHWSPPLAVACGLVLGMFSRPFEVAILSTILGAWVAKGLIPQGWLRHASHAWRVAPAGLVLALGFGLQGSINHSVTGSWFKLPYQLHEEQYGVAPLFIWQKPHEPTLGHPFAEHAEFHRGCSMQSYIDAASWSGYSRLLERRISQMMQHWGWILVVVPLVVAAETRSRTKYGILIAASLATLAVVNGIPWISPNYVAPLIPTAVLLAAVGVRTGLKAFANYSSETRIEKIQAGRRSQMMAVAGLLIMQGAGLVIATRSLWLSSVEDPPMWFVHRAQAESDLKHKGGRHLVAVRYAAGHSIHHEWVYNGADPQSAPVVWARWDADRFEELAIDYPDRRVWILEVSKDDSYRWRECQSKDPSAGNRWIVEDSFRMVGH